MTQPAVKTERRTVFLLALSQALSMTGVSVVMLTTALAGAYLAGDPKLATVPLGLQFIATMCSTFPAAMFMRRHGRRVGFILGQAIGLAGGGLSCLGLLQNSFAMFLVGGAFLGVHNAFWGYYRFAAAEVSDPAFRSRAISLVLGGGIVAALAAPEMAKATRDLLAPVAFAGCYAAMMAINVATIAVLAFTRLPPPAPHLTAGPSRPWLEIASQPKFIVAVLAAMVGYGVMILIMSATPLAMADCDLTFSDTAFVIQWHTLAMFAPSFVVGDVIKRTGAIPVIVAGVLLNAVCVAVNLAGIALENFWLGLVALGLGWNLLYIGGTSLLTEAYQPGEREKVQAANDTLVFATIAAGTFASGALQGAFGWTAVNLVVTLPVMAVLLAAVWLALRERRARAVA